jgi:hypothetical protein
MKRDWIVAQMIIVFLILTDGFNNVRNLNNSANSIWYTISIILAVSILLSFVLFFVFKRSVFYRFSGGFIIMYGVYGIVHYIYNYFHLITDYWYIMLLGLIVGLVEVVIGRRMVQNNS